MSNHFNRTVVRKLAQKGITVFGKQACPAFEGDKFFSGISYALVKDDCQYLRSYSEVIAIANNKAELSA